MNKLSDSIYEVIEEKGLHDVSDYADIEVLTFRQIAHIFTEATEALREATALRFRPEDQDLYARTSEELADVIIVSLDLAATHGINLHQVRERGAVIKVGTTQDLWYNLIMEIGDLANDYRKRRSVARIPEVIIHVLALMRRYGMDVDTEIATKMEKNKQRPQKYGVAAR